jgi:hypothetical protein
MAMQAVIVRGRRADGVGDEAAWVASEALVLEDEVVGWSRGALARVLGGGGVGGVGPWEREREGGLGLGQGGGEGGVGLGPIQREKGREKREEKERGKCPLS